MTQEEKKALEKLVDTVKRQKPKPNNDTVSQEIEAAYDRSNAPAGADS